MAASFKELLNLSATAHGHLCAGQVLGVRMGMLGLSLLGYEAPLDPQSIKKVVVIVEIDRCAADALATVTGVKLGRRSLKFKDYGIMAATFVNLPNGRAVRIRVREDCRAKAAAEYSEIKSAQIREIEAYQVMSATDLFWVDDVAVDLPPEELPGWKGDKAICTRCGTEIRNRREVTRDGRILCRVCAGAGYFERLGRVDGFEALDPVMGGKVHV
jgi:formylmethanofuran dehydrogenase subunit E